MATLWNLERPDGPTAREALAGIREPGSGAHLQEWDEDPATRGLAPVPAQQQVEFMRIRLCLSPDRDGEIAALLSDQPDVPRRLATI